MNFTKSVLGLRITPAQKLILIAIKGERVKVIPIKTLKKITNLSERAIKSSIQALVSRKLLFLEQRSERNGRYAASRYVINIDGILEAVQVQKLHPVDSAKFAPLIDKGKPCISEVPKIIEKEVACQGNIIRFESGEKR